MPIAFNARLRQLREAAGLTQEGLARISGLSVSAVSKLEQRSTDPSWSTVQRLAKALNVSPMVFGDDADEPAKPASKAPPPAAKGKRGRKGE